MNQKHRKITVRILAALLIIMMILPLLFNGLNARAEGPEKHEIPYPEDYPTTQDKDGADAYENSLDHPDSRYFTIND